MSDVKARAADLVGRRAMSRHDLERKLRDKGASEAEARYAAEWMEAIGAINEVMEQGLRPCHLGNIHTAEQGGPRILSTPPWYAYLRIAEGCIVICREFAVSGLRMIASDKGRVIAAGWSGKVKTASTMVCIVLMFLPIPQWLNWVCVWVITLTTIYSGVEYFAKNKDVIATA